MKSYTVTTRIRATPQTVWKILTDVAKYPTWDDAYDKIEGRVAPGETITVHHKERTPRVLPMKITALEPAAPNPRMVWTGGGMPEAIFKGERIFTLAPCSAEAEVEFCMRLVFSGVMAPVITKTIPDMQPDLERFAAALKRRAEQVQAEGLPQA
jgi:hypothetical protein